MWKFTIICGLLSIYIIPTDSLECFACENCLMVENAIEEKCNEIPKSSIPIAHSRPTRDIRTVEDYYNPSDYATNNELANKDLIPLEEEPVSVDKEVNHPSDLYERSGEGDNHHCMIVKYYSDLGELITRRGCVIYEGKSDDKKAKNELCKAEAGVNKLERDCILCNTDYCNPANRAFATGFLTIILPIVTFLIFR